MQGGVFVCHAAPDAGMAQRVVAALEAAGVPCWIAPRDIDPGESYAQAILDGLDAAPAMVLLFSAATNKSPHVMRELESAVSGGIPIVPVRLEQVEPSRDLRYFIGPQQWLETGGDAAEQWEPPLVRAVRRAATVGGRGTPATRKITIPEEQDSTAASLPRRRLPSLRLMGAALVLVVAVVVVVVLLTRPGDDDQPDDTAQGAVPEGRAGMASVFPSLTDDCQEKEDPAVETKTEVYICGTRTDPYQVWYSRWDEDFDWSNFFASVTSDATDVHSIHWMVRDQDVGREWTYQVADTDYPYRWSATYYELPFSVDVLADSKRSRTLGIGAVKRTPPDAVDRE